MNFSLFNKNPEVMAMFPFLAQEFPDGKIMDKDKFRSAEVINRHGSAVVTLLDQMISVSDNPQALRQLIIYCIVKHEGLRPKGMKGQYFSVC